MKKEKFQTASKLASKSSFHNCTRQKLSYIFSDVFFREYPLIFINQQLVQHIFFSSLKIVWDNISMMGSLQYTKEDGATNFDIPYDYCSIMHYGPKYFASRK